MTGCQKSRAPKVPPGPTSQNRALYEQAAALIEEGKYAKARETLTEVGTREVVDLGLDPLVKIAMADAYFYDTAIENTIEAQGRYAQFVSFFPTHDLAGYAQFQIAMCSLLQTPESYLDQTYTHKAIEEFEKVKLIDPGGRFVRPAEQMKSRCLAKLAKHAYEVGMFYYKKKIYIGAIGRFKTLIEDYPQYPDTDRVYYYLGVSLLRWGSVDEGKIYLEKVIRDYPDSRFASKAKTALGQEQKEENPKSPGT